ncbi:hypothetical protein [Streptomyces sp. NPDC057460]|uniref:hypothetical protein n=1 Tax=Streptomyces sp. NPDC057460 TaxID=3346141 RepID=UPI0036BCA6F7
MGTTSVLEAVAPISKVLAAAAASGPEVAALWPHDVDPGHVVQQGAANALVSKPGVRPEVSVEEAADLLYGLLSPELYLLFANERGRPGERWERRRMRLGRPERRVVGFTRVENRTESYIETQTSRVLTSEQNISGRRPEDRLLPVLRR